MVVPLPSKQEVRVRFPLSAPIDFKISGGCSQVVRQWIVTPPFAGSNPVIRQYIIFINNLKNLKALK